MVVRIVKDWNYPESFFGQTPENDGRWGDIQFTDDRVDNCDYLIVLQRPPYDVKVNCPVGNAWIISQEPPVDYFRFYTKSFKYFDRVYSYFKVDHPDIHTLQPVLPWHLLKSYRELSTLTKEQLANKKDELVWITSNKNGFPGQTIRMALKDYFLENGLKFNLYGRGFTHIHDKFDGLFPCKYALAIENYSTENYWTEKFADSLLSWCLPFYWGAPNIEDYFSPDCFIRIDINDPAAAMRTVRNAIENKEWEKRVDAIAEARNKILNEYQFFPYVSQMILDHQKMHHTGKVKEYRIPENPYPWQYTVMNSIKYYTRRVLAFGRSR
jgi:hypothetical protein